MTMTAFIKSIIDNTAEGTVKEQATELARLADEKLPQSAYKERRTLVKHAQRILDAQPKATTNRRRKDRKQRTAAKDATDNSMPSTRKLANAIGKLSKEERDALKEELGVETPAKARVSTVCTALAGAISAKGEVPKVVKQHLSARRARAGKGRGPSITTVMCELMQGKNGTSVEEVVREAERRGVPLIKNPNALKSRARKLAKAGKYEVEIKEGRIFGKPRIALARE